MSEQEKKKILISGTRHNYWGEHGSAANGKAIDAMEAQVRKLGFEPVVLGDGEYYPDTSTLKDYAGFILMGNDMDVAPERYGQRNMQHADGRLVSGDETKLHLVRGREYPVHIQNIIRENPKSIQWHDKEEHAPEDSVEMRNHRVARLKFETAIVRYAHAHKTPLFAVCGGLQQINIVMGDIAAERRSGSLKDMLTHRSLTPGYAKLDKDDGYRLVRGTLRQHVDGMNQLAHQEKLDVATVPLVIQPGTRLEAMYREHVCGNLPTDTEMPAPMVNSAHHQAAEKIARGLRVSAYAEAKADHTLVTKAIEAIDPEWFCSAVQGHPEYIPEDPLSQCLFQQFSQAARSYAPKQAKSSMVSKLFEGHAALGASGQQLA